jgi:putative salt-induced outer membrane protein YdiY
MKIRLLALMLFAIAPTAFGDQLVLTNGDRLTGVVTKFDKGKLYFKTDYADPIAIKLSAVARVTGDKPLQVERSDDTKFTASTLEVSGGQLTLGGATPVTLAPKDLKSIRSNSEELAYQRRLHPSWIGGWQGGTNFGLAFAGGNSDTTDFNLGLTAARRTAKDKTSVYMNTVYSAEGVNSTTTANEIHAGLRYDRDITKRVFAYGGSDFDYDELEDLNLRAILGGGLGYHLIDKKNTSLDLLSGPAYTRELYGTGVINNFISLSFGEQFSHSFNTNTTFTEKAFFLPYLNSIGNYRTTFDVGLSTKVSRLLTWQVSFSNRYVTNPQPTFKNNDLLLTTGLGITFGKKE